MSTTPVAVRFAHDASLPEPASLSSFTERTGITVSVESLSAAALRRAAGQSGADSPRWDLLLVDEAIVAEQIHRGTLDPLGRRAHRDGVDLDDFLQAGIDRFRASDVVYAIPAAAFANVLIYRADLLERFGQTVPATWDALRSATAALTWAVRRDGVDDIHPFVARGRAGWDDNFWTLGSTILPAWGWSWNRGPGEPPRVDDRVTVDALAVYAALLREAGPPSPATLTREGARRHFAAGHAVFLLDTVSELATIRKADPDSPASQAGVALVPIGPTGRPEPGLSAPAYCMPAGSPVKDEAWELLKHLVSFETMVQAVIDGAGAEPARHSVFDSIPYATTYEAGFRSAVRETRGYARINRPLIPYGIDLGEIIGRAAEIAITGDESAATALAAAQREIDGMVWTMDREDA